MIIKHDLTETYDFLLSVIGGAPYGILTIDLEGYITIANHQALEYLGLNVSMNELVEMEIETVMSEIPLVQKQIRKCLVKGRRNFDIKEVQHKERFLTFRGRKIISGMILTIADITSIKKAEFDALNSMLEGQEQERKRLAREIHDGIGPLLSALKMNMANVRAELDQDNQSIDENFQKSYDLIDEAAGDLRSIAHNLMPKVLSDFGLIPALETLLEKVEVYKSIKVDFLVSGARERLDQLMELGLYRICQELINNTIKYAGATKIVVQLIIRDFGIQLMYEDNGSGFDTLLVHDGIGLMNIDSRCKAMGGEALIDSQPGKGMTATIEIPINPIKK